MLARITNYVGDNVYDKETLYLVFCIEHLGGNDDFFIANHESLSIPYKFAADELQIVDEYIPKEWARVRVEGGWRLSFEQWAKDDRYYNYLVENDYYIEQNKQARVALDSWYGILLDYYIKKYAGSRQAALDKLAKIKQKEYDSNARKNGWESRDYTIDERHVLTLSDLNLVFESNS